MLSRESGPLLALTSLVCVDAVIESLAIYSLIAKGNPSLLGTMLARHHTFADILGGTWPKRRSGQDAPKYSRNCHAGLPSRRHRSVREFVWLTARRGDKRTGFTEAGHARLLDAAHQQLGGPLGLVWDNLNTHVSKATRELVAARDWLTVFQLPIRLRAEPGRVGLGAVEEIPGQPGQAQRQRADCAGQGPAQAHAVPARPPQRLPRPHQARPHAPLQLSQLKILSALFSESSGARGSVSLGVAGGGHWSSPGSRLNTTSSASDGSGKRTSVTP